MNKIKRRINAEPEVRADRVAELKDKIKSGEYKVDSEKLAKKMLEDAFQEDISWDGYSEQQSGSFMQVNKLYF